MQDDWKASRKLTPNLGLRYDLYTRHNEEDNLATTFILPPGSGGIVGQLIASNIPAGAPGCDTPNQIRKAQLAGVWPEPQTGGKGHSITTCNSHHPPGIDRVPALRDVNPRWTELLLAVFGYLRDGTNA